jgi:diadenosine tetraphosphate (Ap4A) HIT family hydrolase
MAYYSRKDDKRYKQHQLSEHAVTDCIFCDLGPGNDQFIKETKSFKVIRNIFPYESWDLQDVDDHLLLVPKRHIDSLNDLTRDEAVEYVDIIGSYESNSYNIWARAPQSVIKSVAHQHTHLMKPGNKQTKLLLYLKKPYFRFHR